MDIHSNKCPQHNKNFSISLDGVHESKSTSISMDVITTKFSGCRDIFPNRIIRPIHGKIDTTKEMKIVLDDLKSTNCKLQKFVGDKPKRSDMKCTKCHGAYYPCEYCIGKGTLKLTSKVEKLMQNEEINYEQQVNEIRKQIDILSETQQSQARDSNITVLENLITSVQKTKVRKSTQIVWPASTRHSQLRSLEEIREIATRIERGEKLSLDKSKGIQGTSIFLGEDNTDFNFIIDMPTEYMHLGCLGVVKRLTELTFNVGENRPRSTKRKLTPASKFNERIIGIKSPKELSRRIRELDFAVLKAQEFRNLSLFFFPIIVDSIETGAKERNLWLLLSYSLRGCTIPNNEFKKIDKDTINNCMEKFYVLFQNLFGEINCSYSIHVFCSHLMIIRGDNPLTENSAFPYESFYGEMRKCFVPGTVSCTKQILQNVFIKRALSKHNCENAITITAHDTALESNNMIYTFVNSSYQFYKVIDIDNTKRQFVCHVQGKYDCTFNETKNLNWSKVGVFRKGGLLREKTIIDMNKVEGKVIQVHEYLITCPNNVLREK